MTHRYYVESPIRSDRVVLGGAEAHHLVHVMRQGPGSEVTLFDGTGTEFRARVVRLGRHDAELSVLGREEVDREAAIDVTLAVALPKGERQKWLVEKAVELGTRRLVPLVTARGVALPEPHAIARLQRAVIEASKQCGRNRLMEIAAPQTLAELIDAVGDGPLRLLAHPGLVAPGTWLSGKLQSCRPVVIAVGPEGGFTPDEVELATGRGWLGIDLGPRTLRVETAAIALLALCVQAR